MRPSADTHVDHSADAHVFGDANHQLLVVGTEEEGFRLWCRRCDRLGECLHGSPSEAQHHVDLARKDIAPTCQPTERSSREGA